MSSALKYYFVVISLVVVSSLTSNAMASAETTINDDVKNNTEQIKRIHTKLKILSNKLTFNYYLFKAISIPPIFLTLAFFRSLFECKDYSSIFDGILFPLTISSIDLCHAAFYYFSNSSIKIQEKINKLQQVLSHLNS